MSNQIVISSGAKVRSLEGVLTGTAGIVSSVPYGGANGVATLDSNGKVPLSQLPASVVTYLGTWNAATNTPTLTNGVGDTGDLYICNVAGTVNFGAGPITFAVGDWVIYSGTEWQKSAGATGTVTSVAVTESGDALTITGSPITTAGTINIGFAGTSTQYIAGNGTLVTFPSIISEAQNLVTEVYNNSGATIAKGSVVYINGGQGNLPTITKAQADTEVASNQTIGLVRADITNMNNGYVTVAGRLENLDTQAYSVGTTLYLSPSVAGGYTSTKPTSPDHIVYVGIIVRSHPTQGVIEVKIQNTQELAESSDVLITSPSNNEGLFYDGATSLWKNKTIANVLGYTPANDALVVKLAGTQTITGAKTFSSVITGDAGIILKEGVVPSLVGYTGLAGDADGLVITKRVGATAYTNLLSFTGSTSNTYSFPNLSGTIALLEGSQTFTGLKSFDAALNLKVGAGAGGTGYIGLGSITDNTLVVYNTTSGTTYSQSLAFPTGAGNTYTFPNASGTIALTSNLSSYVPYTGATASLNLGLTNDVLSKFVWIEGDGTLGGILSFKQYATSWTSTTDHTNIYATGNNRLNFSFYQVGGASRFFSFDTSSLTNNTGRTYTMPDASGTVALTSNLSAYLPLTGGTLTGSLNGTSATFSGDLTIDTNTLFVDSTNNRVGIGTTTPATPLHLLTSGLPAIRLTLGSEARVHNINGLNNGRDLNVLPFRTFVLQTGNGIAEGQILLNAYEDFIVGTGASYTPRLTIASTGAATFSGTIASSTHTISSANSTQLTITNTEAWTNGSIAEIRGHNVIGITQLRSGTTNGLYVGAVSGSIPAIQSADQSNNAINLSLNPFGGNVGIGTPSPTAKLSIVADWVAGGATVRCYPVTSFASGGLGGYGIFDSDGTTRKGYINVSSNYMEVWCQQNSPMTFGTNDVERMRITSGGKVLIGATSTTYSDRLGVVTNSGGPAANFVNARNVSGDTCFYMQMGANARDTSSYYLQCFDSIDVMYIYGNGNIVNRNNSYGTLSDVSLKENIVDATPKLDDLLQLKVRNFNLIDDESKTKQIGFIAQEFEEVFPTMIDIDGKSGMKTIKTSVLVPMLVKAIQELNDKVSALENKS